MNYFVGLKIMKKPVNKIKLVVYALCGITALLFVGALSFLMGARHQESVQKLNGNYLQKSNELLRRENQKYREDIYMLKTQSERVNELEDKLKDIFGLSTEKAENEKSALDKRGLGGPESFTQYSMIYGHNFYDKNAENLFDTLLMREKVFSEINDFFTRRRFYRSSPPFVYSFLPVPGRIRSRYGTRIDPISGKVSFHRGIDISSAYWTPVKAIASGSVKVAGYDYSGYGRKVIIDHGMGFESLYAHNVRLNVSRGDAVEKGDVIAYVGSSGRTTGPHLHFELRYNDRTVNPVLYYYRNSKS